MKITFPILLLLFSIHLLIPVPAFVQPLTRAERSHYTETSRYDDVVNFLNELQTRSDFINIKVTTIGKTAEGYDILLAILGNPPPSNVHEMRKNGREAVFIMANIHAGEVEGKEASLMLMREILLGRLGNLLENQTILIIPLFNIDGNEKISPEHRKYQPGPEKGVGVRHNGQNLDLNRDFMKLETPEVQALVGNIFTTWDPVLTVDCHTTNGSYHREPLTYSWPLNPNGAREPIKYVRETMLPEVCKMLKEEYHILSLPYGSFRDRLDPSKGWQTFSPEPRYSTNYIGLRNRMAVLDENYAFADFRTRITACYHLLECILRFTNEHIAEMVRIVRECDNQIVKMAMETRENFSLGLKFENVPFQRPIEVLSYEFKLDTLKGRRKRLIKTDREKTYRIPYYGDFVITESTPIPAAYVLPRGASDIAEKLRQHGIIVEKLKDDITVEVEVFKIAEIRPADRLFQGHYLQSIKGKFVRRRELIPAGCYYVDTAQPLAKLIAYLLEPQSKDGLLAWNFLDRYLLASEWSRQPGEYPIYRVLERKSIAKYLTP